MTSSVLADPVAEYLVKHQDRAEAWLFELLRIPSVSADPAYATHMEAARQALMQRLRQMGLAAVQTLEGGGEPAVYAEYLHRPDKPTILIYGHYDVQPPDPLDEWRSPPFEPTVAGDHIYARGASDVKGSTMIALETVAAFLAVEGACPVNVKIFLEGEEETGSPTLKEIIRRHGERLHADAVLSADGGRASPSHPSINVGARGVTTLEFSVESASKDLHSGRYGGAVRNALHEMSMLLASLHDKDGAIVVDGFLDDVPELLPAQRADTGALPFSERNFLEEAGGIAGGEPGYTLRERVTLRPSIDVNGMWGGYTGIGAKTIIPCRASAKLSIRLVPGQSPSRARETVIAHLRRALTPGMRLCVSDQHASSPASTLSPSHPLVIAASRSLGSLSGKPVAHVRLGASVPITALFKETLGIDTLMFGYNLPDEDVHAPNEFFRRSSITDGFRGWTRILRELSQFSRDDF